MFVPKFPIKNRALALFRLVKRIESNLLVTWRLSYSKSYLVRVSVVHQLNSVDIIMCLLGFFMYILVVLCPGFNFIACISVVANIFPHHSQGGWSWTNFYICRAWYGSFGPAVPILIRRVLNSRIYIQKGIAKYLDDFEGQRINFWSDPILQAPYFDIYASWTF